MADASVLVILFGLVAAAAWGFSDFLAAKASKTVGPVASAFLVNTIGAITFFIIYGLFLHPAVTITLDGFLLAATSGVGLTIGALTFFKGLNLGPVSLVSPISSAYPLATTLLALLVFHVQISPGQIAGIALVMLGVLLAAELIKVKQPLRKIGAGPSWALATVVSWGVSFGLLAQAIGQLGWEMATLIELAFVVISFICLLPFVKGKEVISFKNLVHMTRNKYIISSGIIQLVGVFALNIGLSQDAASGGAVLTAISACYPVLTIFLALRHFKESVRVVPLAGAFISIVGVVTLSLM